MDGVKAIGRNIQFPQLCERCRNFLFIRLLLFRSEQGNEMNGTSETKLNEASSRKIRRIMRKFLLVFEFVSRQLAPSNLKSQKHVKSFSCVCSPCLVKENFFQLCFHYCGFFYLSSSLKVIIVLAFEKLREESFTIRSQFIINALAPVTCSCFFHPTPPFCFILHRKALIKVAFKAKVTTNFQLISQMP